MTTSILQIVTGDSGSFGSSTLTQIRTITTSAGSFLHIGITHDTVSSQTVSSVVSVPALTWTARSVVNDATNVQAIADYTSDTTAATAYTITTTLSAAATVFGTSVKEIGGSSGYDATANAKAGQNQQTPGTGTDAVTTGNTPALTAQPSLISGFAMDTSGTGTPTNGTGFTSDGTGWGFGATALMRAESKRVTSTAALAATFTAGSNVAHSSMATVFTETGAGAVSNILEPWQQSGAMGVMVSM